MKTLKWLNKSINNFFIVVFLGFFYIFGIGITAFFLKLVLFFKSKKVESYWLKVPKQAKMEYFNSPY
jgi:hypothetical protein